MFWFTSKILVPLSSVWFWLIVLLTIALFIKNCRLKNKLIITVVCCFLFFLNQGIVNIAFTLLETKQQPIKQTQTFDYAIVLGGFAEFDRDRNNIEFNSSGDRLFTAIKLYKQGTIKKIILSGGEGTILKTGVSESTVTSQYLQSIGIPVQDIIEEPTSKNTYENIVNCKKQLKLDNYRTLLITSAYHMPRSMLICQKAHLFPTPFPCDFKSSSIRIVDFFMFKTSALNDWDTIIHETVGLMMYFIMGYI